MGLSADSASSFKCFIATDLQHKVRSSVFPVRWDLMHGSLLNSPMVCVLNKHFLSSCTLPDLKTQQKEPAQLFLWYSLAEDPGLKLLVNKGPQIKHRWSNRTQLSNKPQPFPSQECSMGAEQVAQRHLLLS